jgi:hypothetical protein
MTLFQKKLAFLSSPFEIPTSPRYFFTTNAELDDVVLYSKMKAIIDILKMD